MDFIKSYWENQGKKYKDSHWASWGDEYMINLEIELISKNIKNNLRVLDVGCSNGYSTLKQYEKNTTININGMDYAENMIKHAKTAKNDLFPNNRKIDFCVGDILEIPFKDNFFDFVYTTRVLINLPTWKLQQKGIDELLRVVKKNGKVLILEAFWEPLVLLNSLRSLKCLSPLVEHDFNRYLKICILEKFLKEKGTCFEHIDYSSIYYLGSRFLRELVTDFEKYDGYSNPINKLFYEIEQEYSGGGFGIQQAYVIQKN